MKAYLLIFVYAFALFAELPNSFNTGDTLSAEKFNQNFNYLEGLINTLDEARKTDSAKIAALEVKRVTDSSKIATLEAENNSLKTKVDNLENTDFVSATSYETPIGFSNTGLYYHLEPSLTASTSKVSGDFSKYVTISGSNITAKVPGVCIVSFGTTNTGTSGFNASIYMQSQSLSYEGIEPGESGNVTASYKLNSGETMQMFTKYQAPPSTVYWSITFIPEN